jgi:hypothetical protein
VEPLERPVVVVPVAGAVAPPAAVFALCGATDVLDVLDVLDTVDADVACG